MHEVSLANSILESVLEVARTHGAERIEQVKLEIGSLRQVVPDMLQFAFTAVSQGTPAEGAELQWADVPAELLCRACETRFHPEDTDWSCPYCGAGGGHLVQGDELIIRSVVLVDNP